ncbi:hypothetical protein BD310DRAFT_968332 [Dichomitus squalens]|uniref:GST N-terminal domain-containing protein n=1 Tax=Dichomitus squalens TaxID=114155 RepID=A0A4Q9PS12_9APHY|nr:hypothetical protein BD310DRAFT_968332 [Dichomitus squalens]
MSESERITIYAAEESPFPHRVFVALEEAELPYDIIWIDLCDKPDWYTENVYPTAKVPYLVYGGPKLHPGQSPSPDLPQLGESMVILEFLADTFPKAQLLPSSPFLRAKARLFYKAVEEIFVPALIEVAYKKGPGETLYKALEHIQSLLPPTGFAVGDWSIADAAFWPVYLQAFVLLELKPPTLAPGSEEVLETLQNSPRFARLRTYVEENMTRPSATKRWNTETVKAKMARRLEFVFSGAQKK